MATGYSCYYRQWTLYGIYVIFVATIVTNTKRKNFRLMENIIGLKERTIFFLASGSQKQSEKNIQSYIPSKNLIFHDTLPGFKLLCTLTANM